HSRIFRRFTLEGVFSFVLARHDHLETEGVIMVQSQIISRPAGPREVVGELVIEIPFAADGILDIRREEPPVRARVDSRADDAVIRTCAKGKVMSVNAAGRADGFLDLVEFLLDASGAAGGKFYSCQQAPGEGKVVLQLLVREKIGEERHISQTRLGALVYAALAIGTFERATGQGHVELQTELLVEV